MSINYLPLEPTQTQSDILGQIEKQQIAYRSFQDRDRLRDLNSEADLIKDYSGRVVFELLQNALDRAKAKILVRWNVEDGVLEVANDGIPFSTERVATSDGERRSDLESILNLHVSSKRAGESIGNKGIGFRAVFAATSTVEVISRAMDETNPWWGMRLSHPAQMREDQSEWFKGSDCGWQENKVASFCAPEGFTPEFELDPSYKTVIRLTNISKPEAIHSIESSIRELQHGPLTFLERRASPGLTISLVCNDEEPVNHILGAIQVLGMRESKGIPVSEDIRQSTGLNLQTAEVRVIAEIESKESRYWSYLPTEKSAGFGVQIHADFFLNNSRRNIALPRPKTKPGSEIENWNGQLLGVAAECIIDLWQCPEVCAALDFWHHATPQHCACPTLLYEVARRFWKPEEGRLPLFQKMVEFSFQKGRKYPLKRYREFFDAINSWARYSYEILNNKSLRDQYILLLRSVELSQAQVLPIVANSTEDSDDQEQILARSLVIGRQGDRRQGDRIYLRRSKDEAIDLPEIIQRQGTYITTFEPALAGGISLNESGLLPFNRPAILAQLQCGITDTEHEDLVHGALQLAIQKSQNGESVLTRALELSVGSAWRFKLAQMAKGDSELLKAANSLATLKVKVKAGVDEEVWEHAYACGRVTGPWARLDENWLSELIELISSELSLNEACLLLGIGPIPLGDRKMPEILVDADYSFPPETMPELLACWDRELAGFLADLTISNTLREALVKWRWLYTFTEQGIKVFDHLGELVVAQSPLAPNELWLRGGFNQIIGLLPYLSLDNKVAKHHWVMQVGICTPNDETTDLRLDSALQGLRVWDLFELDPGKRQNLIEVYRRLVQERIKNGGSYASIPVLYHNHDNDDSSLCWTDGRSGEEIWHDDGSETAALRAFLHYKLWVVRKLGRVEQRLTEMGIKNFAPVRIELQDSEIEEDKSKAMALRERLREELPILLAAAVNLAPEAINTSKAIEVFSRLSIRHYDDIWAEYHFDDAMGELGKGSPGDVYLSEHAGIKELWFDGNSIEAALVECAIPLSEIFTDTEENGKNRSRIFGSIFGEALSASTLTEEAKKRFLRKYGIPEADVERFRVEIETITLGESERDAWSAQVSQVLSVFGILKKPPVPGMIVNRSIFEKVIGSHCDEEIAKSLEVVSKLRPGVRVCEYNKAQLEKIDYVTFIAQAATKEGLALTEENLAALREKAKKARDGESHRVAYLDFDPESEIRLRLGLDGTEASPNQDALSFAHGIFPLSEPSTEGDNIKLKRTSGGSSVANQTPKDKSSYLEEARTNAEHGEAAEKRVLALACENAEKWRTISRADFDSSISNLLYSGIFGNEKRDEALQYLKNGELSKLLHVSAYCGDAGFDILYPYSLAEGGYKLKLVEVKRVSRKSGGAFYLSEPERRKALSYADSYPDKWQLWLVPTDSDKPVDTTKKILDLLKKHKSTCQQLNDDSMTPESWFFQFEV